MPGKRLECLRRILGFHQENTRHSPGETLGFPGIFLVFPMATRLVTSTWYFPGIYLVGRLVSDASAWYFRGTFLVKPWIPGFPLVHQVFSWWKPGYPVFALVFSSQFALLSDEGSPQEFRSLAGCRAKF